MPRTALSLFGVQVLVALGLRATVHYWQTGSFGVELGTAKRSWIESAMVVGFVLGAVLVGVIAPLLHLGGIIRPLVDGGTAFYRIGTICFALGLGLEVCSQFWMGTSWRVGVDPAQRTPLVRSGPFAVIRNPIFTGLIVTSAAIVLLTPSTLSLIGLVLLIVAIELHVRWVEEPYLRRVHGIAYMNYAATAGRFVPWLGRWS